MNTHLQRFLVPPLAFFFLAFSLLFTTGCFCTVQGIALNSYSTSITNTQLKANSNFQKLINSQANQENKQQSLLTSIVTFILNNQASSETIAKKIRAFSSSPASFLNDFNAQKGDSFFTNATLKIESKDPEEKTVTNADGGTKKIKTPKAWTTKKGNFTIPSIKLEFIFQSSLKSNANKYTITLTLKNIKFFFDNQFAYLPSSSFSLGINQTVINSITKT